MKSSEENKRRIDKTRPHHIFQPGYLVYIKSGNKLNRKKTDPVRTGPYQVLSRISDTFYELDCSKHRTQNFFHSSKLLPYAVAASAEGGGVISIILEGVLVARCT